MEINSIFVNFKTKLPIIKNWINFRRVKKSMKKNKKTHYSAWVNKFKKKNVSIKNIIILIFFFNIKVCNILIKKA